MAKINPKGLAALVERPGRYSDGDGLFFRTLGFGRAYFVFRYITRCKAPGPRFGRNPAGRPKPGRPRKPKSEASAGA